MTYQHSVKVDRGATASIILDLTSASDGTAVTNTAGFTVTQYTVNYRTNKANGWPYEESPGTDRTTAATRLGSSSRVKLNIRATDTAARRVRYVVTGNLIVPHKIQVDCGPPETWVQFQGDCARVVPGGIIDLKPGHTYTQTANIRPGGGTGEHWAEINVSSTLAGNKAELQGNQNKVQQSPLLKIRSVSSAIYSWDGGVALGGGTYDGTTPQRGDTSFDIGYTGVNVTALQRVWYQAGRSPSDDHEPHWCHIGRVISPNQVYALFLDHSSGGGGTFRITFAGQQTATINHTATAAQIQTALEALSNVNPGDVEVLLETGYTQGSAADHLWLIEVKGQYKQTNQTVTGQFSSLSGYTSSMTQKYSRMQIDKPVEHTICDRWVSASDATRSHHIRTFTDFIDHCTIKDLTIKWDYSNDSAVDAPHYAVRADYVLNLKFENIIGIHQQMFSPRRCANIIYDNIEVYQKKLSPSTGADGEVFDSWHIHNLRGRNIIMSGDINGDYWDVEQLNVNHKYEAVHVSSIKPQTGDWFSVGSSVFGNNQNIRLEDFVFNPATGSALSFGGARADDFDEFVDANHGILRTDKFHIRTNFASNLRIYNSSQSALIKPDSYAGTTTQFDGLSYMNFSKERNFVRVIPLSKSMNGTTYTFFVGTGIKELSLGYFGGSASHLTSVTWGNPKVGFGSEVATNIQENSWRKEWGLRGDWNPNNTNNDYKLNNGRQRGYVWPQDTTSANYTLSLASGDYIINGGAQYQAKTAHSQTSANRGTREPGYGTSWSTFFNLTANAYRKQIKVSTAAGLADGAYLVVSGIGWADQFTWAGHNEDGGTPILTTTDMRQLRYRLGIDGTTATPAATPAGSIPSALATVDNIVDQILVDTDSTIPVQLNTIDGKADDIIGDLTGVVQDGNTLVTWLGAGGTLYNTFSAILGDTNETQGALAQLRYRLGLDGAKSTPTWGTGAQLVNCDSLSFQQYTRVMLAANAGRASGIGTTTEVYKTKSNALTRLTVTLDGANNRTAIVYGTS